MSITRWCASFAICTLSLNINYQFKWSMTVVWCHQFECLEGLSQTNSILQLFLTLMIFHFQFWNSQNISRYEVKINIFAFPFCPFVFSAHNNDKLNTSVEKARCGLWMKNWKHSWEKSLESCESRLLVSGTKAKSLNK